MFLKKCKRFFSYLITIALAVSFVPSYVSAEAYGISIGDYLYMGNYLGEPILWRCVDTDGNGPLIVSDKILCIKAFDAAGSNTENNSSHDRGYVYNNESGYYRKNSGSNYWEDSNLRSWLNSNETAGNVKWLCGNPPTKDNVQNGQNAYDNEAGFLTNFSVSERGAMKTVSQKALLDGYEFTKNINKNYHTYNASIKNVLQNYSTAYSRTVTDTVFLLDVYQANRIYNNSEILGADYYKARPTQACIDNSEYSNQYFTAERYWYYWLRSPAGGSYSNHVRAVTFDATNQIYRYSAYANMVGVRPAFYFDETAEVTLKGEGTKSDPYVPVSNMSGSCGENLSWTLNRGTLTISGTGAMDNFTDNTPWGDFCDRITNVVISDGITSVGSNAFKNCTALTDVSLSASVSYIGKNAFSGCTSLINISTGENNPAFISDNGVLYSKNKDILVCYPAGRTDKVYTLPSTLTSVSDGAFENCTALTDIYYLGSEDEWKIVSVGENNEILAAVVLHFTPIYTIHYEANGGENAPGVQTAIKDTSVTITSKIPVRDGYTFIGWATDANAEQAEYTSEDTIEAITSDIVLYAIWKLKTDIAVGDYLYMGNYLGEPILWRCINVDGSTATYISDKIISLKAFDASGNNTGNNSSHGRGYVYNNESGYYRKSTGSNFWEDSNLRLWLNSDAPAGEVIWKCGNPPTKENVFNGNNAYDNEAGFLTGFTPAERSTMKTVKRKTIIDGYEFTSNINKNYQQYNALVSDVLQNYDTAYSRMITDTVFLPDISDIYNISVTPELGETYYRTTPTKACIDNSDYTNKQLNPAHDWYYWLNTPAAGSYSTNVRAVTFDRNNQVYRYPAYSSYVGVRPLFYFDINADVKISGTGSVTNPYTVSEKIGGSCGDSLLWEFDEGVLTIDGTGEMYDYEQGNAPWYDYRNDISDINISDGVSSIGSYAFADITALSDITLPNSIVSVEDGAFTGCINLLSITFGAELSFVSAKAFNECAGLQNINVNDKNPIYSSIDGIMYTKDKKTLIRYGAGRNNNEFTIPDIVTVIAEYAFEGAEQLKSITIPDGTVTICENAFLNCVGITDVYYLGYESEWADVTIANGNEAITNAKIHCIPPLQIYTITYDANGGENAPAEQSVEDNTTVVLSNEIPTKENSTFMGWSKEADSQTVQYRAGDVIEALTSDITLYAVWKEIVAEGNCGVNIKWTLDKYGVLEIIGTGKMYDYYAAGNVPWYTNKRNIKEIIIGSNVENIGNYAFYSCSNVRNVSIGSDVKIIGSHAFQYCDSLDNIVLPDKLNKISECAFYDCISLNSISIPTGVETIGNSAFNGCRELKQIFIPDSVTSLGSYVFNNCRKLSDIKLSSNLSEISDCAFYDCVSIVNIEIPDGVTSIGASAFRSCTGLLNIVLPDSVKAIGDNAFEGCKSLADIQLGNGVETIGELAFAGCTSISTVDFPNTLTDIGSRAFARCIKLTDIILPDSINYIYGSTFSECTGLSSITLPAGIIYIGNSAFYECTALTDVYYNGSKEMAEYIEIDENNEWLTESLFHYIELRVYNLEANIVENGVSISASVENIPENAVLYVAVYDINGKMLNVTVPSISENNVQLVLPLTDAYSVKTFVLDNQTLRPLINKVTSVLVK